MVRFLYNLSTEDIRYILNLKDVYGHGGINETFCVKRDNEMRQFVNTD